jgi:hypothetical protein
MSAKMRATVTSRVEARPICLTPAFLWPVWAMTKGGQVMPNTFGTPEHWLERAEEARTMADSIQDAEAKRAMLAIAENYERIAKRAEARAAGIQVQPGGTLTRDRDS